jgi:hypothetical protein
VVHINERNKALYRSNDYSEKGQTKIMPMEFISDCDDMKTVSFSGDLKASFSDDVTLESAELS